MTDLPPIGSAAAPADIWLIDYLVPEAARNATLDELRPANKRALFDALAAADIVNVTVLFDGCGDSGQIESINAHSAEGDLPLPDTSIELASCSHDGATVDKRTHKVREAIELLCYDLLEQAHGGWENNDGAFGEFTFDVAACTISLDHNDRYTAITSYAHEW